MGENTKQVLMDNTYIIYNEHTREIITSFDWFNEAFNYLKSQNNKNLKWLNRTHSIHKEILKGLKKG